MEAECAYFKIDLVMNMAGGGGDAGASSADLVIYSLPCEIMRSPFGADFLLEGNRVWREASSPCNSWRGCQVVQMRPRHRILE